MKSLISYINEQIMYNTKYDDIFNFVYKHGKENINISINEILTSSGTNMIEEYENDDFLYYTEKQILLISDSPEKTYHIEVSTKGPSTTILIEEDTTSSELTADIVKDGQADVHSKDIEIQWLNDTVAEIMMEGRRDTFHYFLFDANAEEEKIERRERRRLEKERQEEEDNTKWYEKEDLPKFKGRTVEESQMTLELYQEYLDERKRKG